MICALNILYKRMSVYILASICEQQKPNNSWYGLGGFVPVRLHTTYFEGQCKILVKGASEWLLWHLELILTVVF